MIARKMRKCMCDGGNNIAIPAKSIKITPNHTGSYFRDMINGNVIGKLNTIRERGSKKQLRKM